MKILLYADDITLFLQNRQDLEQALAILNSFSVFSCLEINRNKTEAMWVGSEAGNREEYGGIKWGEELKILGVHFSNTISTSLNEKNWEKKINKIKELIAIWSKRNLSISGKVVIIKTFLISQFVYLMQSLVLPDHVLNAINTLIFRFLWKKKNTNTKAFEKIKRKVMCNTYENGGIQMLNIKDMQCSFLISWTINLLHSKEEKWSLIPKFLFSEHSPNLSCFKCNATLKNFVGIDHIRSVFWKKSLVTWLDNKCKLDLFKDKSFRKLTDNCLWNNEQIKYRGKCLYLRDWSRMGINCIEDFKNPNILSFRQIVEKVGNSACRLFEYNALSTAIRSLEARNLPVNVDENYFLTNSKIYSAKDIRRQIIKETTVQPCSVHFWQHKLNVTLTPAHWMVSRVCTNEERLRLLHFKIIHNIYPTSILLNKMKIKINNLCSECKVVDYIEHFFFHCKVIKKVWIECQNYIFTCINQIINLNEKDVLFGYKVYETNTKEIRFINHVILITKMIISKYKYGKSIDIVFLFNHEINIRKKFLHPI